MEKKKVQKAFQASRMFFSHGWNQSNRRCRENGVRSLFRYSSQGSAVLYHRFVGGYYSSRFIDSKLRDESKGGTNRPSFGCTIVTVQDTPWARSTDAETRYLRQWWCCSFFNDCHWLLIFLSLLRFAPTWLAENILL